MSSRWSYGPDGLRERPVAHTALLPSWRDLQPFLLRSAGVVGLVATIMAVVSSDALQLGAEEPAALAAIEPLAPPMVAPAAELRAAPELAAPELAAPEPQTTAATASPLKPIAAEAGPAAEPAAPAPIVIASASDTTQPPPEPAAAPAPIAIASASETAEPVPEPAVAVLLPDIADFAPAEERELMPEPAGVASGEEAPLAATDSTAAPSPSETSAIGQATGSAPKAEALPPVLASELRNGAAPALPTSEVATTASVPAAAEAMASLSPNADEGPAAEISLSALRPSDTPKATSNADRFAWADGAATCPRDWVEAEEGSRDDGDADCMTTASLLAPVAEDDQAALEDAATEEATVLASLPRIPLPRPEPPADFKPSNPHKAVRVSSRNLSWPAEPPPSCAAGQRAKWRFVDRRAGTKEWYCR